MTAPMAHTSLTSTRWDNWDAIKELGEELTEVSERMSA